MDSRNPTPYSRVSISITVCSLLISVPLFFEVWRTYPQESLSLQAQGDGGIKQTEVVHTFTASSENESEHEDEKGDVMFGIPKLGKDFVIIYNAVPKCGSRSLLYSLSRLKKHRGMEVDFAKVGMSQNIQNVSDLGEYIVKMKTPGFVSGQLPFQNYNRTDVIYINMIRNPLDRLVSLYYFDLYGDKGGKHNERFLHSADGRHIFPLKILAKEKGFENRQSLLYYFAGNNASTFGQSWESVVTRAKDNIREHFIFVGITEEYQASMKILEQLIPDYMKGLLSSYLETKAEHREKFATVNKTAPSAETVSLLMKHDLYLKYDFEIYNFVKQYFNELKQTYL